MAPYDQIHPSVIFCIILYPPRKSCLQKEDEKESAEFKYHHSNKQTHEQQSHRNFETGSSLRHGTNTEKKRKSNGSEEFNSDESISQSTYKKKKKKTRHYSDSDEEERRVRKERKHKKNKKKHKRSRSPSPKKKEM